MWSLILTSTQLYGQNSISEEKWNELVSELPEYSGGIDPIRKSQAVDGDGAERAKPRESYSPPTRRISIPTILVQFLRIAFIVLGVAALIFLLYQFYRKPVPKDISSSPLVQKRSDEERLDDSDIDELQLALKEALARQDYQEAVRYQYLILLKVLLDKKQIQWKREKTNQEYAWEVMSKPFFPSFKRALQIFQEVWFGNLNGDHKDYLRIQSEYEQVVAHL